MPLIYGIHAVSESLKARRVSRLVHERGAGPRVDVIVSRAQELRIPTETADRRALDKLTRGGVHQGVAAELQPLPAEEAAMRQFHHQRNDLAAHGVVDVMDDLSQGDAVRLRRLVENHLHYTGSERARDILDNWAQMLPKFRKVLPVEYRRALEEMARARLAEPAVAAGE